MKYDESAANLDALSRRNILKSAAIAAGGASLGAIVPGQWARAAEAKASSGWQVLFDGKKLDKWDFRPNVWTVQEDGSVYSKGKGGNLFSKEKFQDFTLDIKFKMSKGCNSGVFIRMASRRDWLHSSMEIQVLDSFGKKNVGKHDCGAVYDALVPSVNAAKKAGEWNRYFITCFKNRVFISLNAVQIIDMDLNKWTTARQNPDGSKNKFRDPLKTLTHPGFFAMQTHGKPIWYRDIRVKPLTALGKCPKCGKEGPVGWYCCAKCNTVCAPVTTVKCGQCKQTAKAGTFCAKGNLFHLPAAGLKCGECDNAPGMACEMDLCGYAFCSGAWYCDKCKKPFPYKGAGCPTCKKKK